MILIKLGILLAVPITPEPIKKTAKKTKDKKGRAKSKSSKRSEKSSKRSKKSSKSSKKPKKQKEKPPKPEYVLELGKPKGYFHIQYTLLPKSEPHQIDVVHWEKVSKIFSENNVVMYKNLIQNDLIWIPIMLEHRLNDLEVAELEDLKNHVLEFLITPNKKKLPPSVRNDKTMVFFIKEEDVYNEEFAQAFDHDPNVQKMSANASKPILISTSAKRITDLNNFNVQFHDVKDHNQLFTKIYQFDTELLYPRFKKIINKIGKGEDISSKEYIPLSIAPMEEVPEPNEDDPNTYKWPKKPKTPPKEATKKPKTPKQNKPKKKAGEKKKRDVKIKVSGESFFTDPSMCVYRLSEPVEKLQKAFIILSTKKLMSKDDLQRLNPLVLKLKSLRNLPVDLLLENKFSSIYLQYNIPGVARHIGTPKMLTESMKEKIRFNESHVFFNPPEDLKEFLYSQRLMVELVGVYTDDQTEIRPKAFGTLPSDHQETPLRVQDFIWKKPKTLVLGVACFDLSLLLRPVHDLQLFATFRHPNSAMAQPARSMYDNIQYLHPLTMNEMNFTYRKTKNPVSPLHDGLLIDNDTCLKIHVVAEKPICGLCAINMDSRKYMRMILIVYNMEIAKILLNDVILYNQDYMPEIILLNYFMYHRRTNEEFRKEVDPMDQMITGFCIDNVSSAIIYLEGTTINWCMHMLHNEVKVMNESICKLYYNSEHAYSNRIYKHFVANAGIYITTLKYPLQKLFKVKEIHFENHLPKPAYEALKKIEFMLYIPLSNQIYQYAALPTEQELMSMSMEFGVAHRLYN